MSQTYNSLLYLTVQGRGKTKRHLTRYNWISGLKDFEIPEGNLIRRCDLIEKD